MVPSRQSINIHKVYWETIGVVIRNSNVNTGMLRIASLFDMLRGHQLIQIMRFTNGNLQLLLSAISDKLGLRQ